MSHLPESPSGNRRTIPPIGSRTGDVFIQGQPDSGLEHELLLITVEEICYFQSDAKYMLVVTPERESLIHRPIKELLDRLDPQMFWQIRRGTLVNVNAIAGVQCEISGHLAVRFKPSGIQGPAA